MSTKLCLRLGLTGGGAVGLLLGLLHGTTCCNPPTPPTTGQLMLGGVLVAVIAELIAAALACLILRLPLAPVFTLALLISIVVGVLLGPLAYYLPNPGLALFICALIGALLGWIICLILCGRRDVRWEVSR
jgi:hypothetical protein